MTNHPFHLMAKRRKTLKTLSRLTTDGTELLCRINRLIGGHKEPDHGEGRPQ